MSTVTVSGEHLHYQLHHGASRAGGAPLVLLHGAGGNLMYWPSELRRLPGHTVYALDLPGHGKSGGAGRAEIGAYAEVVRGFVEALALLPIVLAGHSMGGAIAQEFALRYPSRLAGLVLVATGARLRMAPQLLDGALEDFAGTAELLAQWTHAETADPNLIRLYVRRLREVSPQVVRGDFAACDAFDRRADICYITLPTLILCGDAERMTPVKHCQWLHEQITRSQLVVVPGAGHMVMLEQPAAMAEAVAEFLVACLTCDASACPSRKQITEIEGHYSNFQEQENERHS
jgi:pimeloyl-ACP methyl ester carboxylesterase